MTRTVRNTLFVVSAIQAVMAVAFFLQLPLATAAWPFAGSNRMTFMFVSSIYAAAATSTFWAVASKNYAALAGIGLDYVMILTPVSIVCFRMAAGGGNEAALTWSAVSLCGAIFGLLLLVWSLRIPLDRTTPLPLFARRCFGIFVVSLLAVSLALMLGLPNVIPWEVTPELSVVIGSMYLGASSYFFYGLVRPTWSNAAGQLAGFLAYDLVLIGPFIMRFATVEPALLPSLIVYTTFVGFSGVVAAYYLFINETTRFGRTRRVEAALHAA